VIGQTFGRLTVVARGPAYEWRGRRFARWACSCACGRDHLARGDALRSGSVKSCGCLQREAAARALRRLTWTGDKATSEAVHLRLRRERGRASEYACVDCGEAAEEWSFDEPSGYSVDLSRYAPRCIRCHREHDLAIRGRDAVGRFTRNEVAA